MFCKIVIVCLFLTGSIASEEYDDDSDFLNCGNMDESNEKIFGDLSIVSTHNTNNEIAHHPDQYELLKATTVNGILHYVLGARIPNDVLVAQGGQNQTWPIPHNVNIQLSYPAQGYGAAVSYVAIVVNQTSAIGRAYVVKGGINQHLISVVVEAYDTLVFNVYAYIYGA